MNTSYNARAVLRTPSDAERVVDELAGYSPAVSPAGRGRVEVVLSAPAESLRQAVSTALALLERVGDVETFEVMTSAAFDARAGLDPLPELLSVTQAAGVLGVSRQAVLQRLESGSLPGMRAGSAWVLPAAAVHGV